MKLLWLAICNIEDKRASERARLEGRARENRSKTVNKLIEGTFSQGWSEALGVLVLNYSDRLGRYLDR